MPPVATSVDAYIAAQPVDRQAPLVALRQLVLAGVAPDSEGISYGMPAYRFANGHPIYFAAWKRHTSLHDIPALSPAIETRLAPYRSGKDTLKFPAGRPIPFDLIADVIGEIARQ